MLTNEDREALLFGVDPLVADRTASVVEAIVARHVAAALEAAAVELNAEERRNGGGFVATGDAARIVRTAANAPPT